MPKIPVTVIILHQGEAAATHQCVHAILADSAVPMEIRLVGNESTESMDSLISLILRLDNPQNVAVQCVSGFSEMGVVGTVNLVAASLDTTYFVLLKDDFVPLSGWLKELYDTIEQYPDAGVCGSKLMSAEGSILEAGAHMDYTGTRIITCEGLERHAPEANVLKEVAYCSTNGIIVRQSVVQNDLLKVSEGIGSYEDIDLCFQIRQKGHRIYYQPKAEAIQAASPSCLKDENPEEWLSTGVGLFRETWMPELSKTIFQSASERRSDGMAKIPAPSVTLILLCWNKLEETKRAVESIVNHTYVPYSLFIVDNGSSDDTPQYLFELSKQFSFVRVITLDHNYGFAGGMNAALQVASTDFVAILNNDLEMTAGWLERMLVHFYQHPNLGMIGPLACNVSGLQGVTISGVDATPDKVARKVFSEYAGKIFFTQRIVGFAWVMRREVLERVGGFDLRFGQGNFEDDDFCIRTQNAGYQLAIAADVFLYHKGSASWDRDVWQKSMVTNAKILSSKWGPVWDDAFMWIPRVPLPYDKARDFIPPFANWLDSDALLLLLLNSGRLLDLLLYGVQGWNEGGQEKCLVTGCLAALQVGQYELAIKMLATQNALSPVWERVRLQLSVLALYMVHRSDDLALVLSIAEMQHYEIAGTRNEAEFINILGLTRLEIEESLQANIRRAVTIH